MIIYILFAYFIKVQGMLDAIYDEDSCEVEVTHEMNDMMMILLRHHLLDMMKF